MRLSKQTKSHDQHKVLRMIARNEQLERYAGKWVAMNRKYKDRSKYNRRSKQEQRAKTNLHYALQGGGKTEFNLKDAKRELRRDLRGSYCIQEAFSKMGKALNINKLERH